MPEAPATPPKPVAFKRSTECSKKLDTFGVTPRTARFSDALCNAAKREHRLHMTKALADCLMEAYRDAIYGELVQGRHVTITGLGCFKLIVRKGKPPGPSKVLRVRFIPAVGLKKELSEIRV